MKRLLLALSIVGCGGPGLTPHGQTPTAGSATPTAAAPTSTSRAFEDPEGQFSVRFPVPFESERTSEALAGGTMITLSLVTPGSDPLYMAVKVTLDDIAAYDCQKGLDGMRDETMARVGCKVDNERKYEIKGNPAREIVFTCTKRHGVMLLACDPTKAATKHYTAYEIVGSGSQITEESARQFTGSFVLK